MDKSVYTRPNKPKRMAPREWGEAPAMALPSLPDIIEVDSATQCHVTPPDVAARMVEYLEAGSGHNVLEPSAGTGNLLAALFDSGHSAFEVVAIERYIGLCNALRERFPRALTGTKSLEPINACFLDYAAVAINSVQYPRIIMNPPFLGVKRHIDSALSMLGKTWHSDAILVALVPISYQHNDAETLEELPRDTFSTCTVSTKIIRFSL